MNCQEEMFDAGKAFNDAGLNVVSRKVHVHVHCVSKKLITFDYEDNEGRTDKEIAEECYYLFDSRDEEFVKKMDEGWSECGFEEFEPDGKVYHLLQVGVSPQITHVDADGNSVSMIITNGVKEDN